MFYQNAKRMVLKAATKRGVTTKGRGQGYLAALNKELRDATFQTMTGSPVDRRAWTMIYQWLNQIQRGGEFPGKETVIANTIRLIKNAERQGPGHKQAQMLGTAQAWLKKIG